MLEIITERGYATGGVVQKKNACKRESRARTPGAPS
jgi:hypothetical protein